MDDPYASLPESTPASPVPESVSAEDETEAVDVSHLPAEHRDAVRRLYRRVEQAAATIERLRAENERLRRRVEELEAEPTFPDDEAILRFDDDPEALRARITQFIDAIDTHLETSSADSFATSGDEETDA